MSIVDRKNGTFSIACDGCGQFIKMSAINVLDKVCYATVPPYDAPEPAHYCNKCYVLEAENKESS